MTVAALVIFLRLSYSVRVSRTRFETDSGSENQYRKTKPSADRVISWLRSNAPDREIVTLTPPSTPDRRPLETVRPNSKSVFAAGVLNALVGGLVLDGNINDATFGLRVLLLFEFLISGLFLIDGAVVLFLFVNTVVFGLLAVLSIVSIVHMKLALGGVEYRLYDTEVVAYDNSLAEPQWAVPYDCIEDISVKNGLFGSPLWLNAGTVSFERVDSPPEDGIPDRESRSSIAFVPDPERVAELVRSRKQ